jgi:hypothetical protein
VQLIKLPWEFLSLQRKVTAVWKQRKRLCWWHQAILSTQEQVSLVLIQAGLLLSQTFPRALLTEQADSAPFFCWPEKYSANGRTSTAQHNNSSPLQRRFETLTSDLNLNRAFWRNVCAFYCIKLFTDVTNCLVSIFFLLSHTPK